VLFLRFPEAPCKDKDNASRGNAHMGLPLTEYVGMCIEIRPPPFGTAFLIIPHRTQSRPIFVADCGEISLPVFAATG